MKTFAKLRSPVLGKGKTKVEFTRDFSRWKPQDRIAVLNQVMRDLRKAHDEAAHEEKLRLAAEDVRNANDIRVRA